MAFRSQVPLSLLDTVWNVHLGNLILMCLHAQLCGRRVVSGINKIMPGFFYLLADSYFSMLEGSY